MITKMFAAEREESVKSFDQAMDAIKGDFQVEHYGDQLRNLTLTEEGHLDLAAGSYPITSSAFDGLCRSIRMPSDFGRKIPVDLFIYNFDALKAKLNRRLHICITKGTVVSVGDIMPEPIRNAEILTEATDRAERTGMKLHDVRISDRGMQIDILDPRRNLEPIKGDVTSVGLNIVTSEMGLLKTKASLFLMRLVCSNGAIVKKAWGGYESLFDYRVSKEKSLPEFFDKMGKASFNYDAFSGRYRRLTERELNAAEFLELHGRLAGMIGTEQADNVSNISRDQRIELKNRVENGRDSRYPAGINAYDFYNSITHAVKGFPFSTRRALENFGGSLIQMIPAMSFN
ncbi:MAG: DUF932 domain-containing protein [Nitrospirae bacterium]|nr:DUF932 domain-containing protein [Nitrospirota bacterium]